MAEQPPSRYWSDLREFANVMLLATWETVMDAQERALLYGDGPDAPAPINWQEAWQRAEQTWSVFEGRSS